MDKSIQKITVNASYVEFGYEMILALPYAYYLHKKGILGKTISGKDSKELYYFSPNHEELDIKRHWDNMPKLHGAGLPLFDKYKTVHFSELDKSQWIPPPYKQQFKNDRFKAKKPLIVVSNKYNVEWGKPPVNFIDIDTLIKIFEILYDDYYIVYNHMTKEMGFDDTVESLSLNEFEMIEEEFPEVMDIRGLLKMNPDLNYNSLQLMLYANCENYISIQGGSSIFSSFFGGNNIIYAKEGQELIFGSYLNWYKEFGGSLISVCNDYDSLLTKVEEYYG